MKPPVQARALRVPSIGGVTRGHVRDVAMALFNVDGHLYAVEDHCLRCAASLADGVLAGTVVACRSCGWRYDVATGCVEGLAALRITTFAVRVDGSRARIDAGVAASPKP